MDAHGSLAGRTLAGRYRITAMLGQGGMATAYRAQDLNLDREVVVKVPHAASLRYEGFRERFAREVRSLTKLEHPHVIPVFDSGEEDGTPWCAVQYMRGGDLADVIAAAGGRLPLAEVSAWLPRVAETLDFVHERGFLHRDVTPVNILFDEKGHVYLSDFGVAAILRAADDTLTEEEGGPRLTAEGSIVGAALYAPPEAVRRDLTPAYDQYSLALVVYNALTGFLPFPQTDDSALMLAKNREDPMPLDERGVPLPRSATTAVMRALARDPTERFPSCTAFASAFAHGGGTQPIVAPQLPAAGARPRWGLWGGAAALLAAVGTAVWLWPSEPTPVPVDGQPAGAAGTRHAAASQPGSKSTRQSVLAATSAALGSTAEELDEARALCESYAESCPPLLFEDETPRVVAVGPFVLDRHEVSNTEFAAFAAATGYVTGAEARGYSFDGPFRFRVDGLDWRRPKGHRSSHRDLPRHPVVHVSAADARAYCEHQGGRLPDEDEWEYAARGGDRRLFPWGSWGQGSAEKAAWARAQDVRLRPVGSVPGGAGPFGHQDLAGNVWEWTSTREGQSRILKGGSWMSVNPAHLRPAGRMVASPEDTNSDVGFRCARSPS